MICQALGFDDFKLFDRLYNISEYFDDYLRCPDWRFDLSTGECEVYKEYVLMKNKWNVEACKIWVKVEELPCRKNGLSAKKE